MANYIGAIDQGTTSTRFMVFDRSGRIVSAAQKEHAQIYPRPGWVEHDPAEIWRRVSEVIQEAMDARSLRPSDLSAIGITNQRETTVVWNRQDRPARLQRHRLAGHPRLRCRCRVRRPRRAGPLSRPHRSASGHLLQRPQAPLDSEPCGRRARRSRSRRPALRQHRHLPDLEPDRRRQRRRSRHRRDQRQPHPVDEPEDAATGTTTSSPTSTFPHRCCPGSRRVREVYGTAVLGPDQGRADRRRPRRPAGGALRPGLLPARRSQEHLRHRLLHADEHRRRKIVPSRCGLLTTLAYKLGDQPAVYALEGSIAITGALVQWLRDNLGLIEKSSDIEALAALRRRQRRRLFCSGVLRTLRAVLEGQRPRRHRRTDPLRQQGAPCPRRAGGHRLPGPRGARRHGRRIPASRWPACAPTAAWCRTIC